MKRIVGITSNGKVVITCDEPDIDPNVIEGPSIQRKKEYDQWGRRMDRRPNVTDAEFEIVDHDKKENLGS